MSCGIAPLVRVRSINDPDVSLLLDNGAVGIVYPDINTAEEAQRAVDACKFASDGQCRHSGTRKRESGISRFRVWSEACHRARIRATRWDHPGMTDFTTPATR